MLNVSNNESLHSSDILLPFNNKNKINLKN